MRSRRRLARGMRWSEYLTTAAVRTAASNSLASPAPEGSNTTSAPSAAHASASMIAPREGRSKKKTSGRPSVAMADAAVAEIER